MTPSEEAAAKYLWKYLGKNERYAKVLGVSVTEYERMRARAEMTADRWVSELEALVANVADGQAFEHFGGPLVVPPPEQRAEAMLRSAREFVNAKVLIHELVLDFGLEPDPELWQRDESTYNWHRRDADGTEIAALRAENERLRVDYAEKERSLYRALVFRDAARAECQRLKAENESLTQRLAESAQLRTDAMDLMHQAVDHVSKLTPVSEPPHDFLNRGVQRIGRPLP